MRESFQSVTVRYCGSTPLRVEEAEASIIFIVDAFLTVVVSMVTRVCGKVKTSRTLQILDMCADRLDPDFHRDDDAGIVDRALSQPYCPSSRRRPQTSVPTDWIPVFTGMTMRVLLVTFHRNGIPRHPGERRDPIRGMEGGRRL